MGAKKTSDLIPLCHPLPMLKAADKHMVIGEVMLTEKTGGTSGAWVR